MKLWKFPLPVRSHGSSSSLVCKGMHREREVLEHQLYIFLVFFQQLLEGRLKPRTVWSLIIAEYY